MSKIAGAFKSRKMTKPEIFLALLAFCAMLFMVITIGHSVKNKRFFQIWVPADQMDKIERTCQHEKEVRVKYPDGAELVLPCSAIEE